MEGIVLKLKDLKFWAGLVVVLSAPMTAYQMGATDLPTTIYSAIWIAVSYALGIRQDSPTAMAKAVQAGQVVVAVQAAKSETK